MTLLILAIFLLIMGIDCWLFQISSPVLSHFPQSQNIWESAVVTHRILAGMICIAVGGWCYGYTLVTTWTNSRSVHDIFSNHAISCNTNARDVRFNLINLTLFVSCPIFWNGGCVLILDLGWMGKLWTRKWFYLDWIVMVIVILGILSAFAIPKYIDLKADAATAAVNGVAGALNAAMAD